ncbi:root hair defective 3 GTP-binding protein-domain-containing protein [Pavlovales sp. CCMP2436]|nr:root hair defective 3 GTP-binding protein-domain-containing protein [Pavlovales sp. CCMP2436]
MERHVNVALARHVALALALLGLAGAERAGGERGSRVGATRLVLSRLANPLRPPLGAPAARYDIGAAACAATFGDLTACAGAEGAGEAAWPWRLSALRGGAARTAVDDGQLVQLLDERGGFTNASLSRYLAQHGLARDANYSIVSVLGPQSSGKSTLLNALFGTRFDVMDAARGRSQTTKGAWAGKAKGRDTVILDMQGTDSREGGEDSKSFERQSALFALAVSDTLVINLWVHDLGRYNAANLHLLRTIIEVHLRLFGAGRRRLLFLCRDHVRSVTPMAALERMVRADLDKIWAEVPKPKGLERSPLDAHFDVQVTSLPHFEHEKAAWQAEALLLRPLLEWRATAKPSVPADGLEPFARSVWDTIVAERDLDLPSQREMLARFRCGEVADAAVGAVRNATGPLVRALLAGGEPVANLGVRLGSLLNASLSRYERVAALYDPAVAAAKRAELRARLTEAGAQLSFFFEGCGLVRAREAARCSSPPSRAGARRLTRSRSRVERPGAARSRVEGRSRCGFRLRRHRKGRGPRGGGRLGLLGGAGGGRDCPARAAGTTRRKREAGGSRRHSELLSLCVRVCVSVCVRV